MRRGSLKTIGVLSAYAEVGRRQSAIAYYAKTIMQPLYDKTAENFIVYADKADAASAETVTAESSNVVVHRCWNFGLTAPFQILRALWQSNIDVLHVEYDVYLYGGVVSAMNK